MLRNGKPAEWKCSRKSRDGFGVPTQALRHKARIIRTGNVLSVLVSYQAHNRTIAPLAANRMPNLLLATFFVRIPQ